MSDRDPLKVLLTIVTSTILGHRVIVLNISWFFSDNGKKVLITIYLGFNEERSIFKIFVNKIITKIYVFVTSVLHLSRH